MPSKKTWSKPEITVFHSEEDVREHFRERGTKAEVEALEQMLEENRLIKRVRRRA